MDLVNNFCKVNFPLTEETGDTLITEELLMDRFEDYSSQVSDVVTCRRVGVCFIKNILLIQISIFRFHLLKKKC